MGYCLNCLDEPVFIAVSKTLLTEFDIHHRLESCVSYLVLKGVGLKNSTFRLFLVNEKGCTKFEHTLRVCIAVLSFWGLIWDASSDAEYIFVDVERQKKQCTKNDACIFFHCTTQTGCGQLGAWAKKQMKEKIDFNSLRRLIALKTSSCGFVIFL